MSRSYRGARRRNVAGVRRIHLTAGRTPGVRPAAALTVVAAALLASGCGASTTGGSTSPSSSPPVPALSPPSSPPAGGSAGTASGEPTIARSPINIASSATCVDGWSTITAGSSDYSAASLLLPQVAGAQAVRVFTGPVPGGGTGLHVYARTATARWLAVQVGDGPGVVATAGPATHGWKSGDWRWAGSTPRPAGLQGPDPVAAGLLSRSVAGCLDGT